MAHPGRSFLCAAVEKDAARARGNRILNPAWHTPAAPSSLLRRHLTRSQEVDPKELPALTYQLLLLAGPSKPHVLRVLNSHFEGLLANADQAEDEIVPTQTDLEQLRPIMGTSILHIQFAVKQDQQLGQVQPSCPKTSPPLPAAPLLAGSSLLKRCILAYARRCCSSSRRASLPSAPSRFPCSSRSRASHASRLRPSRASCSWSRLPLSSRRGLPHLHGRNK